MKARWTRRMIGQLRARLPDAGLGGVVDPRRGKSQWALGTVLRAVVVGMPAGAKSFKNLGALTAEMAVAARRALGFRRRLPDTTARALIVRLSPADLMNALYRQMRAAYRRRALEPSPLPWGVLSMDGKHTAPA
jgi:hypothetical protein